LTDYPGEVVLDTYNYQDGKFCPLVVALELDKIVVESTHDKVFQTLTDMGYKVYNTRGIAGSFYTTNRKEDLLEAAKEVLQEKLQNNANY
jgi:NDP-sugar pyrophosphorylase family protein